MTQTYEPFFYHCTRFVNSIIRHENRQQQFPAARHEHDKARFSPAVFGERRRTSRGSLPLAATARGNTPDCFSSPLCGEHPPQRPLPYPKLRHRLPACPERASRQTDHRKRQADRRGRRRTAWQNPDQTSDTASPLAGARRRFLLTSLQKIPPVGTKNLYHNPTSCDSMLVQNRGGPCRQSDMIKRRTTVFSACWTRRGAAANASWKG